MKIHLLAHFVRGCLAVLGSGAALVTSHQSAHAVTDMFFDANIIYSNGWSTLSYYVHLPASQADAQGYINNGASIEVSCYGDQRVYSRVHTGTSTQPVYATGNGVVLTGTYAVPFGTVFDVNNGGGQVDKITCYARWVDGAGDSILKVDTRGLTGYF